MDCHRTLKPAFFARHIGADEFVDVESPTQLLNLHIKVITNCSRVWIVRNLSETVLLHLME